MFELPKLNYPKNALTPAMSEETLDLHHGKHHQTYITNLNNLIKDTPLAKNSLEEIVKQTAKDASKAAIFNNAGQHWNHILFWNCMKPKGGGAMPEQYRTYFTRSSQITLLPIDLSIANETIALRTQYTLKTPDAIQLGTAIAYSATYIITNDRQWKQLAHQNVLLVDEM